MPVEFPCPWCHAAPRLAGLTLKEGATTVAVARCRCCGGQVTLRPTEEGGYIYARQVAGQTLTQ